MEFSFDRQNDNLAKKSADPIDTSTIANERLRKAIERNRAKQAGRETSAPPRSPFAQPAPAAAAHVEQQASFFEKPVETMQAAGQAEESVREPVREPIRQREPVREVHHESQHQTQHQTSQVRSTSVVSRRSVAKPDDTEFVPVKRATKKVASQISYSTSTGRKKPKSLDPKLTGYLVKGCWIFCGVMVLRLIFANGGVTDYYSQKSQVNERVNQLKEIKKENMQLVREIERMRTDAGFQKKLVRDNLGFIANDEFLILFPKEN